MPARFATRAHDSLMKAWGIRQRVHTVIDIKMLRGALDGGQAVR
jgi:hypothetical protein